MDILKAIGVGSGVADAVMNPLLAHWTNQRNQRYNTYMYDRQRTDALEDWNRQNDYNSPRAQMQRYQEAGLNPNLIYGQMQTAQPVRSSSAGSAQGEAPRLDAQSKLLGFYEMQRQSAQIDLTQDQLKNNAKERDLKDAQIIGILKNAGLTDARIAEITQGMGMKAGLYPIDMATRKARLGQIEAQTGYTLAQTRRLEDLTPVQKKQVEQQIAESEQRVKNLVASKAKTDKEREYIMQKINSDKVQQKIREEQLKLWEKGINPNDKLWQRILAEKLAGWIGGIGVIKNPFSVDDAQDKYQQRTWDVYKKKFENR